MDNYPVLCTIKYKDRRMSLTYRLRIKPVYLKTVSCKNATCYLHGTASLAYAGKCKACRSETTIPEEKLLFKIYTSSSTDVVDVVAILRKIVWVKQSRFRKPQTRWLSNEVYMFKQSYDTAKEWFEKNKEESEQKKVVVKKGFEKKLTIRWEKEMPSNDSLLELCARRKLLKEL